MDALQGLSDSDEQADDVKLQEGESLEGLVSHLDECNIRPVSDSTKIPGFRNVSTSRQAVFITEGGEAKISQISPRRWRVLPRGGETYEVSGKQEAIDEARGIVSGLSLQHLRGLQEKQRGLQSRLSGTKRAHSTKRTGAGFLASRVDGTTLPAIASEHLQNIRRAASNPEVAERHAEVFQKLLDGHETLSEDDVRRLRHAARHPELAGSVKRSLMAAADLHEAARLADESGAGVGEEPDARAGGDSLTPGEIRRDIERVVGAPYPPRGGRSRRGSRR